MSRRWKARRSDPVRVADRRADVLVRGLSQRDGELWSRRLYGRSSCGIPEAWRHACWIAYDRDEAGDAAAEQLKKGMASSARVLFPKGMDANEYALKVTPAAQSLAVLLNRAGRQEARPPATGDR